MEKVRLSDCLFSRKRSRKMLCLVAKKVLLVTASNIQGCLYMRTAAKGVVSKATGPLYTGRAAGMAFRGTRGGFSRFQPQT